MMFNFFAWTVLLLLAISFQQGTCSLVAVANLHTIASDETKGILVFTQENANTSVRIQGTIAGLDANTSIDIHVYASPADNVTVSCATPDGQVNHTSYTNLTGHLTDLANITTDSKGVVYLNTTNQDIKLYTIAQYNESLTVIVHQNQSIGDSNSSKTFCVVIKLIPLDKIFVPCSMGTMNMQFSTSILLIGMIFNFVLLSRDF